MIFFVFFFSKSKFVQARIYFLHKFFGLTSDFFLSSVHFLYSSFYFSEKSDNLISFSKLEVNHVFRDLFCINVTRSFFRISLSDFKTVLEPLLVFF